MNTPNCKLCQHYGPTSTWWREQVSPITIGTCSCPVPEIVPCRASDFWLTEQDTIKAIRCACYKEAEHADV